MATKNRNAQVHKLSKIAEPTLAGQRRPGTPARMAPNTGERALNPAVTSTLLFRELTAWAIEDNDCALALELLYVASDTGVSPEATRCFWGGVLRHLVRSIRHHVDNAEAESDWEKDTHATLELCALTGWVREVGEKIHATLSAATVTA